MSVILGLGLDVVEIERIDRILGRHGERFVERICRPDEPRRVEGRVTPEHLAGLFAAKEAVMKALGSGWAEGIGFRQVEVSHGSGGRPRAVLHDRARERASRISVEEIHLSITHERRYAAAVAILTG